MGILPGYVFEDTEEVTAEKLRLQFTDAVVSGLTQSNSSAGLITPSLAPPPGSPGFGWFTTGFATGFNELLIYDNEYKSVAMGFVAINSSGLTIGAGSMVKVDSSVTAVVTGSRVSVKKTGSPFDLPIGIALEEITNGNTGLVVTRGKARALKDGVAVLAGGGVVPTATATDGQVTTSAVGSWGNPYGSSCIGVFLEDNATAAGNFVTIFLTGMQRSSWWAFKSAPAVLLNAVSPSALATWQTAVSWSSSPAGTTAHMIQVMLRGTGASTSEPAAIGFRANGSALTIDTGAVFISGNMNEGVAPRGLRGTLIVPATTANNQFQWYVDSAGGLTALEATVTVHEIGAIVGGQII